MLGVCVCSCVSVCAYHCIAFVCVCVCEKGEVRLAAKINGVVFGCIPEEHLHQSRASRRSSQVPTCICVCNVCVCRVCASIILGLRVCALDTGKIENPETLPYHRFTVPAFPFSPCVCVLLCVIAAYEALHQCRPPNNMIKVPPSPQRFKVIPVHITSERCKRSFHACCLLCCETSGGFVESRSE